MFKVSITEGWVEIMLKGVDSSGMDKVTVVNENRKIYLFFLVFLTIGAFFILNIFDNIIVDNYKQEKHRL